MTNLQRSTESDIARGVLRVLAASDTGSASMQDIIQRIPLTVTLTVADRDMSDTRPNEEMWEQQVRNITSHHNSPGNFIHEGYLQRIAGGLQITDAGRAYIASLES
jgi:hypothetical protein